MAAQPPKFLSPYLPDAGFQWITMHKKAFTTYEQCLAICEAMSQAGRPLSQAVTAEYIAQLFSKACTMVEYCEGMQPAEFWHMVGSHQLWTYRLQGRDLADFALRVMAARVTFRHRVKNYHEDSKEIGDIPQRYRNRDHSIANKAVDAWITTVIQEYGLRSPTRILYCPDGLAEPIVKWAPIGAHQRAKKAIGNSSREEGFHWYSKYDKPFVTSQQVRNITKSMKKAGRRLDRDVTAEYLTNIFFVARQLIGRCGKLQPSEFWAEVGSHLVWARSVSGTELHDFSNRILSARNSFNESVQFYRERNYKPEDIPDKYRTKVDDELHRAMDEWVSSLHGTYGRYSEIKQLYYPQWLVDSDNEGSAEATMARFKERVDESRRQRGPEGHGQQETDIEGVDTDDDDMEMEGCEEYGEEDVQDGYGGSHDGSNGDFEGMNYEIRDGQGESDGNEDVEMMDATDDGQPGISTRLPFRPR
ncbi:uncharacterized protein F4807DRAFT_467516, partial [Annulohypoxylon truncatum]|uniref:uncharacterized protein n=1 Tax=Annulohypoxylon truncatum TaxID=327061 RepID=UPI002008286B